MAEKCPIHTSEDLLPDNYEVRFGAGDEFAKREACRTCLAGWRGYEVRKGASRKGLGKKVTKEKEPVVWIDRTAKKYD